MLIKLIKYELKKRWRELRNYFLGFILIQTVLLIIMRVIFNSNMYDIFLVKNSTSDTVGMPISFMFLNIFNFLLVMLIIIFPLIDSIKRYGRDLSGKQAVLELMIPITSWKKNIAKLIATLCTTFVCELVGLLSGYLYLQVLTNFDKTNTNAVRNLLMHIVQSPVKSIYFLWLIIFAFASLYMLVFFCIALAKSVSHKNKFAVPIGIVSFAICMVGLVYLTIQLDKIPYLRYNVFDLESSFISDAFSYLIFCASLFGTSWLMEKKIEH